MQRLTLKEGWEICREAAQPEMSPSWLPLSVPGDTRAEALLYDVQDQDGSGAWLCRTTFILPLDFAAPVPSGERIELVFEGLAQGACVSLNGTPVHMDGGRADVGNMLVPDETNVLDLRLERLPPLLWRDVLLERVHHARIRGWSVVATTLLAEQTALLELQVTLERLPASDGQTLRVLADGSSSAGSWHGGQEVAPGETAAHVRIEIAHPALWWTWDLGVPHLYDLVIRLTGEDGELDRIEGRVGLRDIRLHATQHHLEINGIPLKLRGMIMHTTGDGAGQVDRAIDANMNMLYIPGATNTEDVLDRCDTQGVLVWHAGSGSVADMRHPCVIGGDASVTDGDTVRLRLVPEGDTSQSLMLDVVAPDARIQNVYATLLEKRHTAAAGVLVDEPEAAGMPLPINESVKHAFAPVTISFRTAARQVWLWIDNDTRNGVDGWYEAAAYTADGRRLWHRTGEVTLNPLASYALLEVPAEILDLTLHRGGELHATLTRGDDVLMRAHLKGQPE